jgi:hypothetical protein
MVVTDDPEEVVRVVVDCYERHCASTGRADRRPSPRPASRDPESPASPRGRKHDAA